MNTKSPQTQAPSFREIPGAKLWKTRGGCWQPGPWRCLGAWTWVLGAFLIAGCNLAPQYAKPRVETPVAFKELTPEQSKETDGWKTAEPRDDAVRGRWWEMFGDTNLNALELQVNISNQTVAAAFASFLSARAVANQGRSQLFPTLGANPSVTRSRQPLSQGGSGVPTLTSYTLPLDASWEPDFWGSLRNTYQAGKLEAQATLADLENTRLTIQSELAADYFQLRSLDAQQQLLNSTVHAYRDSLQLERVLHDTGIASDQDVAQAETQLNTTEAQATDLGIARAQMEHAIALLIGRPASAFGIATNSSATTPIAIPFGFPSQLLERRPDIAAAERRAAEANAQIGVARAAYFPTITLSGSAGYRSTSWESLFTGPTLVWSVGATLAETIFDAGRRRAVTEQAWATYQGAIANYRQTVLMAFQEVEDNLASLRILSQELQQQDAAVASSQRYLKLANERYRLGIDSYLNIIAAQTLLLGNQRTALNLRMEQMTASVQLIKALGGGWNESQGKTAANP